MLRIVLLGLAVALFVKGHSQSFRNEWIDFGKTYYKFPVRAEGIIRIPKTTLNAAGLGDISAEHFQLWRQGKEVAIFTTEETGPLAANGFIEFYGRPNDGRPDTDLYLDPSFQARTSYSLFTDTALYYLTVNTSGPNARIKQAENPVLQSVQSPDSFFIHTYVHPYFEQFNGGFAQFGASINLPGETFWTGYGLRSSNWDRGEGYCSNGFSNLFPLTTQVNGLRAYLGPNAPPFSVRYHISGNFGGAGPENSNRTLYLSVSDSLIDTHETGQFKLYITTKNNIPASKIISDGLKFFFTTNQPYYWDASVVNALDITYARRFHFAGQRIFRFSLPENNAGNHLRIAGFTHGNTPPALYDQTNRKRYNGVLKGDSILFQLQPSATARELELGSLQNGIVTNISFLARTNFRDFRQWHTQGDYLIISHNILFNDNGQNHVEAYRQYRSSSEGGGFRAVVYDVEELAEQFGYGIRKHPIAIRNFVRYAMQHFVDKPRYVLLLGRGTNYLDYAGSRSRPEAQWLNSVPTWGWPGSDQLLVASSHGNPVPMVPIGRVSAATPAEIKVYLDKLKQYELLVNHRTNVNDKQWQKNVLLLAGGDDPYLTAQTLDRLENPVHGGYRKILEDSAMGANVHVLRRVGNPQFADSMQFIYNLLDSGVGILGYYGHSSASSIDFNLGNPEEFKNGGGKLPVFLANGCRAGNIFDYNPSRLYSKYLSVSDNYVFAKTGGSIAFISNSENISNLNAAFNFNSDWYHAASKEYYGRSIGDIQKEAVRRAMDGKVIHQNDGVEFQDILNAEQSILHGDPAIIPFPYAKPDFATSTEQIVLTPADPNVSNDSVWVKAYFSNLGRYDKKPLTVELRHVNPYGQEKTLMRKTVSNLANTDSIQVKASLQGLVDAGQNSIVVALDPFYDFDEITKDNNTALRNFNIESKTAIPVFPYPFAIVPWSDIKLTASTADALAEPSFYRFEMDTTEKFNSSLLIRSDVFSRGGAISTYPEGMAYQADVVYYWRVAPLIDGLPYGWQNASFIYKPGIETGFNQSHYFQHTKSNFDHFAIDSVTRQFEFGEQLRNLYINHGIYGSSGSEDSHFSLTAEGIMLAAGACVGQSIIFNVFDPISFKPWSNAAGGRFGSGWNCGNQKAFNFEFKYFNHTNRKLILDFLDSIPKGHWVAARLVVDPPYDSLKVEYWKRDTALFGSGRSLYHAFYNQGFYDLDELNRVRTFGFVFKKDDSTAFKAVHRFSDGVYDRVTASVFPTVPDSSGVLKSPLLGPSSKWKNMLWNHQMPAMANPQSRLNLWGWNKNNQKQLLRVYSELNKTDDIRAINATQYPFLQFELLTKEPQNAKPLQLDYWRLYYDPVPDGAISAADYWSWNKDTLYNDKDTLRFGVAFKNVSRYLLDSTQFSLVLGSPAGNDIVVHQGKLKKLAANDTAIISASFPVVNMGGRYHLKLVVNEARLPVEQQYFNNTAYLPFYVIDGSLPLALFEFEAKPVNQAVETKWQVETDKAIKHFELEHSRDGIQFGWIGTIAASGSEAGLRTYQWTHQQPAAGDNFYRVKLVYADGTTTLSAIQKVHFGAFADVRIFPNPFADRIRIQPLVAAGLSQYNLRLFDASGKLLLSQKGSGTTDLDVRKLPAGAYWLHYNDGQKTSVHALEKH